MMRLRGALARGEALRPVNIQPVDRDGDRIVG
jgi:hypothetical protein